MTDSAILRVHCPDRKGVDADARRIHLSRERKYSAFRAAHVAERDYILRASSGTSRVSDGAWGILRGTSVRLRTDWR